jgi:signal transduction histidine kinase
MPSWNPQLRFVSPNFAALIEPSPALLDRQERQQSRLLLFILLILLITSGFILLVQVFTNPSGLDDIDFWVTTLIWFIGMGMYLAARRGRTQTIAASLIFLLFILTTLVPLTANSLSSLPFYGVIPLLLTAIFFQPRWVIRLSVLIVFMLTIGYILMPPAGDFSAHLVIESILFTLPVGGITWAFTWQRHMVERIRREELQTAYNQVVASEAQLEQRVQVRTQELLDSQEALRTSEAHHNALLRAIPDVILLTNRDGTYLDYHIDHPEQARIALDQLIGQNASRLHLRELPDALTQRLGNQHYNAIQDALSSDAEINRELSLPLNGQDIHYEARVMASGQDKVLTIIRNISERKKLEAQTLALMSERERIEVLNRFVQNISHELRTPLSIISTGLHLMNRSPDGEKRLEYARRSEQQIVRINRLLGMILSMTRLNSGLPFVTQPTNLIPILEQVTAAAQQTVEDKQLRLEFVQGSAQILLNANGEWLHEAFTQLLDNAIRFTLEGGSIRLSLTEVENGVEVLLKDTGIGIAKADLPHVFEHFWRQDSSHSTPGFGLGLTLAQKIVQLHDGEITIESAVGNGTAVRVFLPIPT